MSDEAHAPGNVSTTSQICAGRMLLGASRVQQGSNELCEVYSTACLVQQASGHSAAWHASTEPRLLREVLRAPRQEK